MHVTSARHHQRWEIADVLARAFLHDPYIVSLFGTGTSVVEHARSMFVEYLEREFLPYSVVDVALDDDGAVAGAALWSKPGQPSGSLLSRATLVYRIAKLVGRKRLFRAIQGELVATRMHPKFTSWYLFVLGVDPELQSGGIGAHLLNHRIVQIGAQEHCYLEATSPRAARLYARYGFMALGEVPLPGLDEAMLAMWRPAQNAVDDFTGFAR